MAPNRRRRESSKCIQKELAAIYTERDSQLDICCSCLRQGIMPNATDEDLIKTSDYQRILQTFQKQIDLKRECLKKCQQEEKECMVNTPKKKCYSHTGRITPKQSMDSLKVTNEAVKDSSNHDDALYESADEPLLENLTEEFEAAVEEVRTSKLHMALQGLRSKQQRESDNAEANMSSNLKERAESKLVTSVEHQGRVFYTGKCYAYQLPDSKVEVFVGITGFYSKKEAKCVLVVPFSETFLGQEEDGVNFKATCTPSSHVQVHQTLDPLPLQNFGEECSEVMHIPDLVYEPQVEGSCFNFAYFYKGNRQRCGMRRNCGFLDLFSGAGGMGQGFSNCNFTDACAVEKDSNAAEAYQKNHPASRVECMNVTEFLGKCRVDKKYKKQIGKKSHIHASSPCQGFSGANVFGGVNDEANNDLSYCLVDAVKLFVPVTASFENVMGLWRRKHLHYLKNILADLMELGYQVRCCQLIACDYGDPQARPRLFLLAARRGAYLPSLPQKTHGQGDLKLHVVTARDALEGLCKSQVSSEHQEANETVEDRLVPDFPAATIRASKRPYHYKLNRRINKEEAAALFSFPHRYTFVGGCRDQLRQIGNAVPVKMATAVAYSIRTVLDYVYCDEENDL